MLFLLACVPTEIELGTRARHTPFDTGDTDDTDDTGDTDLPAETGDTDTEPVENAVDWTVLLFINGDNDLEEWALEDVNEMEQVGSDDRVHFIVQLDRSEDHARSDGDWTGARRYRIEADDDTRAITSPVLEDLGAVDSGSPTAIADFVAWGAAAYPAERYALVLWDHGDGWLVAPDAAPTRKGISYDDGAGTVISVAEGDLETTLQGVTQALGGPIDLLGLDACTMMQWEVAHVAAPYADILVASQDYEDVTGWAYDTSLADLTADPDMDAATFGAAIALRFSEIPDSTQSVLDLSRMPEIDAAIDALATALMASADPAAALETAASGALGFDGDWSRDHDFGGLLDMLENEEDPDVRAAAAEAHDALGAAILANYTERRTSAAQGLTIYSPTGTRVPNLYKRASWSDESLWDDFLVAATANQ